MALNRDAQALGRVIGRLAQKLGARRLHLGQDTPRRQKQPLPRRRQAQWTARAVEQRDAEIALQRAELVR